MLVQALAGYADLYLADQLNDPAWEKKPVPWLLEVSTEGIFLGVTPRMTEVARGKKRDRVAMELDVPRSPVNRNSGHHPLLAADDISYVLGRGAWTPEKSVDRKKAEEHHKAFVFLVRRAAAETLNMELEACGRFYADPVQVERARMAFREAEPGTLLALSVGAPLVEHPVIRAYWRNHYKAAFAERMEGVSSECLISGAMGTVAPTHEKVKGVSNLGGQPAGVSLMSFDKEAFRSYGWEQNENSPVSPERAMAYVLALNHLLRSGNAEKPSRRDKAGIGFIFWLGSRTAFDPFEYLDPPDMATVDALRDLCLRVELQTNMFHLAGVTGNGGRLRVRYWVTDSLGRVARNMFRWHEQLRLAYPWDDAGPLRFWQLEYVLDREGKPPAHHFLALLRRAIEGEAQPLGYAMLAAALRRLCLPEDSSDTGRKDTGKKRDPMRLQRLRVPVALIRLCVNDIHRKQGVKHMSEGLDESCSAPAYICGRLMAVFENLQRASSENEVNTSIVDRYFALASTYPSAAFPKIESLAQKHLHKLRRERRGAAIRIDEHLQELHKRLQPTETGSYPAKLGLEGQGLFALGYYHQKARAFAQAAARKQFNESAIDEHLRGELAHEHDSQSL